MTALKHPRDNRAEVAATLRRLADQVERIHPESEVELSMERQPIEVHSWDGWRRFKPGKTWSATLTVTEAS